MISAEQIVSLRKSTGLSQQKFADFFHIPVTTLRDWEQGRRTPPSYVPEMMQTILSYVSDTADTHLSSVHSEK